MSLTFSPFLANTLWQASCYAAWKQFTHAAGNLEKTQLRLLQACLHKNRDTLYGRRYGFAGIHTLEEYQARVPLSSYDDYQADLEAIAQGKQNILTAEPVQLFELSSGSSAASKLIPYTARLKAEFQRGIGAWIFDLFRHYPHLKRGAAYWSVTPLTGGLQYTAGGIPVGFEDDTAYLNPFGERLLTAIMAVPSAVKHIAEIAGFRYLTLLFLLRRADLRIISVWNPTFLTLLLDALPEYWDRLLADIAAGSRTPPEALPSDRLADLKPLPERAAYLQGHSPTEYTQIWPDLGLVSCWMDGQSARYAERLRDRFPGVMFQPKGLIATEAFVSFPCEGRTGAVLSATSHFFEFLPVDPRTQEADISQAVPAHRLNTGHRYGVVVTTGGGLYRYQLHDLVEVTGYFGRLPCLRFIGKTDRVSDWFGEKLNEYFVADVLRRLFEQYRLSPDFALLAPDDSNPEAVHYRLYLDLPAQPVPPELGQTLDALLCENFHYAYCRKLGQLQQADIRPAAPGAAEAYLQERRARGHRLGNIKMTCLEKTGGWHKVLCP